MTGPIRSPPERVSLKSRLIGAAKWALFGYGAAQLLRLASNLILTRLLAPEMLGLVTLANVLMIGVSMLSDVGLAYAALRSPRGDDPRFLNVVWVLQIGRGIGVTVLALLAAALLSLGRDQDWLPSSSVFASPQLPVLLVALSAGGIISGFESTKIWWARRHLSLAGLTRMELATQAATTAFMLTWAWISPTIWALVAGWLFSATLKAALSHIMLSGPSNRLAWDAGVFREVFAFGKWTLLSSTLTFILSNGDRLLLGALVSASTLGVYSIAFMLINTLQSAVVRVVGFAVLPALSEVVRERPQQLRDTLYRVRRPLDALCMIAAGALTMLGPAIVDLLYDPRYADAGWMLGILGITLLGTTLEVFDQCLLALGRPQWLSLLNAFRVVTLYSLIPLGYALYGLRGAVGAIALSATVNGAALLVVQARMGLVDVRREVWLPAMLIMGLAMGWILRQLVNGIMA